MRPKLACASMLVLLACAALPGCKKSTKAAPPPTSTPAATAQLDGQKFDVTMVKEDGEANPSTVRFEGGDFISSYCATFGFQPSTYSTTKAEDGSETFEVTATSTTMDLVMSWAGTIRGDAIEGAITCTKKDGTPDPGYEFSGTRSGS